MARTNNEQVLTENMEASALLAAEFVEILNKENHILKDSDLKDVQKAILASKRTAQFISRISSLADEKIRNISVCALLLA